MARSIARVWPALLALLVLAPLLRSGYVLTYDMVFVPHQSFRLDYLGLGAAVPRAVPSDALVSWLSLVLPGSVLQKIILLGTWLLAGYGMLRLMRSAPVAGRVAAVSWFVWNPYVAERLVLGQWVVLVGYATLPWVLAAALEARRGSTRACAALILAAALASISASGALMAAGVGLPVLLWRRTHASVRQRLAVVAGMICVSLPWLVAGLIHSSDLTTSRAAIDAFSASDEGRLPAAGAVLGLGGVWNSDVVPGSRAGWVPVVWLVVLLVVVVVGVGVAARVLGRPELEALLAVAALSFIVSLAGVVDAGLLAQVSDHLAGAALLRDGTRYLGGLAVVQALLFGYGTARLTSLPTRSSVGAVVGIGLCLAPLAVLPDLGWGAAGRLQPVAYPTAWSQARDALVRAAAPGSVLVLPGTPYRAYSWNDARPNLDPAPRYFPGQMLASDALTVDGFPVQGNDPTTQAALDALSDGDSAALRQLGVGSVVVDAEVATQRAAVKAVGGQPVFDEGGLAVYILEAPDSTGPTIGQVVLVALGWLLAATTLILCVIVWARTFARTAQPAHSG